jgi:hypothetical protein
MPALACPQCSGMRPEAKVSGVAVDPPPPFRELWVEMVVRGFRSKFGLAALVFMVAATVWEFARGNVVLACVFVGIILFTYLRVLRAVVLAVALAVSAGRGAPH